MPKYEPGTFNETKYKAQFSKENYDELKVRIPKGNREKLRQLATDLDMRNNKGLISVNRLIINAIEKTYKIKISNPKQEINYWKGERK